MFEFLRGWKRTAGCVTLVMACVLMAGWMRSIVAIDYLRVEPLANFVIGASSFDQAISFKFGHDDEDDGGYFWLSEDAHYWNGFIQGEENFRLREPCWPGIGDCPNWHLLHGQFCFGVSPDHYFPNIQQKFIIIPYWPFATSLTLLSAWLLLSKPRTKKQTAKSPARPEA